tara:strand:+ start:282761 stop:283426 length:666 start_codon:yes stop_codon:yes gene_type:complete
MLQATERIIYSKDWVTLIFILIIALFVMAKYSHSERFSRLFSLLHSRNYLVIYSKYSPLLLNSFNLFFALIQLLIFSLLIFVSIKTNYAIAKEFEFTFFLNILTGVFIFIVLRYFIGKLLAILFQKVKEHEQISYLKISYLSNFCLLVFPLLVIALYVDTNTTTVAIITTIVSIAILLLYYFLIIRNNQKTIFNQFFYFILYLCALEVAPLIFLYKLFINV